MSSSVALIGVPSSLGGLPLGSEKGPASIREAGLVAALRATGLQVSDLGDVPVPKAARRSAAFPTRLASIEAVARWVAKTAWRALAEDRMPLVVGGDHSVSVGSIAASAERVRGLGIVWLDAHPDFNTPDTSPSGNVHGMVLAIAAGWGPPSLTRLLGFAPMVHPDRVVVIGARSFDAGERNNLRQAGVRMFDSDYLERHGVGEAVAEAMAHLASRGVRSVHLSVDLDVLDPVGWPGVSTPVPGGLNLEDLALAARTVAEMAPIAAMDVVELTPPEDTGGATAQAAVQTVVAALGSQARLRLKEWRPAMGAEETLSRPDVA